MSRTITLHNDQYVYLLDLVREDMAVAADGDCGECGTIDSLDKLKECIVYKTLQALGDTDACEKMISNWKEYNCCKTCNKCIISTDCDCSG